MINELRKLHEEAGAPSYAAIAARAAEKGHRVTSATAHNLMTGRYVLTSWRVVWAVVAALGGDEMTFFALWRDTGPGHDRRRDADMQMLREALVEMTRVVSNPDGFCDGCGEAAVARAEAILEATGGAQVHDVPPAPAGADPRSAAEVPPGGVHHPCPTGP